MTAAILTIASVLAGFSLVFLVFFPLGRGAIYMPSSPEKALLLAELSGAAGGEKAADLGSGDGRVVIALARRGAEAHGFEVNPILVLLARRNIRRAALQERAFIHWKSFWRADLSGFNVLTLFQGSFIMRRLEAKVRKELAPGARVVSDFWGFPSMAAEKTAGTVFVYRIGSAARHSDSVDELASLMRNRRTVVLSGAGISTESGIPDYRGPQGSLRTRAPIMYREFVQSTGARQRYWARSAAGWARVRDAKPNAGHRAIAQLESLGVVSGVITQNVDRLHQAAGSRRVLELHGALAEARCMDCGRTEARERLQERLAAANLGWTFSGIESAPDGDAEVSPGAIAAFSVPACQHCGGVLRPDVVFFGENVPAERVEEAGRMVDEADGLLVAGSSLTVFSGFRFVQRAFAKGIPVAIVNKGPTRGDGLASIRIDGLLGKVLPELVRELECWNQRPNPSTNAEGSSTD